MALLTNMQKVAKIRQQTKRIRELYEQKFTRADWDAKKPEALKHFQKCKEQAVREIWGA